MLRARVSIRFRISWNNYLIVNLFFSKLGFWNGNLLLIAPFPDRCLPFFPQQPVSVLLIEAPTFIQSHCQPYRFSILLYLLSVLS